MYSLAPRCSEAWSPMSTPAWRSAPPSAASAPNESSVPASSTAALLTSFRYLLVTIPDSLFQIPGLLVMHLHPFRHRPGLVELGPQRHRDEEHEVEEGQHAADDGLHRVGARTGADLAQPQEADHEHRQNRPGQLASVAVRLYPALVPPRHQATHPDPAEQNQHAPPPAPE